MAKTVAAVAEAATAAPGSRAEVAARTEVSANPPATRTYPEQEASPQTEREILTPQRLPVLKGLVLPDRAAGRDFGHRARHLKDSVWHPLAVFSGALWLRVTGTFFALIAATMGSAAWRGRNALHTAKDLFAAHHFWLFVLFATLFGYFAISNFLQANLKEHRGRVRR